MGYRIRSCILCEKDITIKIKRCGQDDRKMFYSSEDGVLYEKCYWLCNKCWNKCLPKEMKK
jgi:hypothetical protein